MENDKISSIGRPLDFNYKTNKAIVIITTITIIFGFVLSILKEFTIPNVILTGVSFGITFFVSWAISREIDPDNSISAFIGLIPLYIILFFWTETNIIILFWLLISLRIIKRTTGLPARIFDSGMLFVISVLLSYFYSPIFGLLSAIVFLFDAKLIDGQKFQVIFASLSLFVSIIFFTINNKVFVLPNFSMLQLLSILIIAIVFVFISYFTKDVKSKGDRNNEPLSLSRVRAAQIFVLFSVLLMSFVEIGLTAMIPVWCVLSGVIIHRFSLCFKD